MEFDHRIREAETGLFARHGLRPEESFLDLPSARVRLRVVSVGAGPALVLLHGGLVDARFFAPNLAALAEHVRELGEDPPVDLAALRTDLAGLRERGFHVSVSEREVGIAAASAWTSSTVLT